MKRTATQIITNFLKDDPNPPKLPEIKAFKAATSASEWIEFAQQIDPTFKPDEKG